MKKLFTFFCVLLICGCHAQTISNSAITASYVAYAGGKHQISLQTLQACATEVRFRFSAGTADVVVNMNGNSTQQVYLDDATHQYTSVDIKTSTNCSGGTSANWITLQLKPAVLAVHVMDFSARPHASGVLLLFRVLLSGGDYFDVERSGSGGTWKRLGTIRSEDTHSLLDMTCTSGTNYYRLKLHEGNEVRYSNTIVVRMQESEPLSAKLYSISGAYLGEITKAEYQNRMPALPRGIYVLRSGDEVQKIRN